MASLMIIIRYSQISRENRRISLDRKIPAHGFHEKSRSCASAIIFCAILLQTVLFHAPVAGGGTYAIYMTSISEDSHHFEILTANPGDTVKIDIKVIRGSRMDVYIMEQYDYIDNYSEEKDFSPVFVKEKKEKVDDTWKQRDDRGYYLVIDNEDNPRDSDAVPDGSIAVEYSIDNHYEEKIVIELTTCIGIVIGLSVVGLTCLRLYYLRKNRMNRISSPIPSITHEIEKKPSMSTPFYQMGPQGERMGKSPALSQWDPTSERPILEKFPRHGYPSTNELPPPKNNGSIQHPLSMEPPPKE